MIYHNMLFDGTVRKNMLREGAKITFCKFCGEPFLEINILSAILGDLSYFCYKHNGGTRHLTFT